MRPRPESRRAVAWGLALALLSGSAMADVRLETGRFGNVFAPGEEGTVRVLTDAPSFTWTLTDFDGKTVDSGQGKAQGGAAALPRRWQVPGYYELAVEAGGQTATTSLAVVPKPEGKGPARFGVMTHFAQGWETDIVPLIARLGVNHVRDELYWAQVEKEKGRYAVPDRYRAYMQALGAAGITPLVVLSFENKHYDDGQTPHTAAGHRGFANYARFLAQTFRGQVPAVEVWNEYNGSFCKGPCKQDRPGTYVAMLAETYRTLKADRPDLVVAGGAAVLLPQPWFQALFDKGALDNMDAVAIHPYRPIPEGLEDDLEVLQRQIRDANGGRPKPVWATEVGRRDPSPQGRHNAARYMVKISAILLTGGVDRVYWYLLRDYDKFGGMGLVRSADDPMGMYAPAPTYPAYATLVAKLGTAEPMGRVKTDPRTRLYRFDAGGAARHVAWSSDGPSVLEAEASGPLTLTTPVGATTQVQPKGGRVTLTLDETPVYIDGPLGAVKEPGRKPLLADSRLDFAGSQGAKGWTYTTLAVAPPDAAGQPAALAAKADGNLDPACPLPEGRADIAARRAAESDPLEWKANEWSTTWRGKVPFLEVTPQGGHPGVTKGQQVWVVRNWTAETGGPVLLKGRANRSSSRGDGTCALMLLDGKPVWSALLGGEGRPGQARFSVPETLKPGTTLTLAITPGPGLDVNNDSTSFEVQVEAR
ncbi:hypothetical protein HHL28_09385 [Aerophototrophica crusticola]|uniref:Asl1-like glycosyl hydrolase catalytic domain-containing protein n=1 Tax=Aerophototrophica crusticola TaxID=1709002 RepID=A0A858R795_9PROT|nr:hypothetical protein HHL28_09385 [Rhodospirillaceae bacterium B3]